ncbi:MAG: helix-turn-helix transcriptional regulator [Planctomycetota bacterium]|nr:helix-turn-helix transcriptional regulator [Planctomycetota bacterium]
MPARIERFKHPHTLHPAVPACGRSQQRNARDRSLALHQHEVYELCVLDDGVVDWVIDGRDWRLAPGDAFLTRPGDEHGSKTTTIQPCTLRWVQLDPSHLPGELATGLRQLSGNRWPKARHLIPLFDAYFAECAKQPHPAQGAFPNALDTQAADAALRLLIIGLLRHSTQVNEDDALPPALRAACASLAAAPEQAVNIPALCAHAGIGKSRLHQLFQQHHHCSPGDYLHRLRTDIACDLLTTTTRAVTDIAFELGYASSQHFARTFRRFTGLSPSGWRQQQGAEPT